MNIYQRINEVRKAVNYVQKDAKVMSYKAVTRYKAVTHDAVAAILHDPMVEQGIICEPSLESDNVVDTGTTTKSGTPIIRYEAIYNVSFINEDEPADRAVLRMAAHANDEGDKGPGKALSYATKNAMLKIFQLETGENDESRVEGSRRIPEAAAILLEFYAQEDQVGAGRYYKSLGHDDMTDLYTAKSKGGFFDPKQRLWIKESEGVHTEYCKGLVNALIGAETLEEVQEIMADNQEDKKVIWKALPVAERQRIDAMKARAG